MESSDNNAMSSPAPTSTARRSGRVSKVPEKFVPDAPAATKRKRSGELDDEDAENESPDEEDHDDDEETDDTGEDDVEPRNNKKSSQATKPKKPAAKKPKINGDAPATGSHAARLPSRPKKVVRLAIQNREGDGLYGKSTPPVITRRVVLTIVQPTFSAPGIHPMMSRPSGTKDIRRTTRAQ